MQQEDQNPLCFVPVSLYPDKPQSIPQHIALIMDGNGRWSHRLGLSRAMGHRAGAANMLDIVQLCVDIGVRFLTVYAFSTENWKRPQSEVQAMLQLIGEFIDTHLATLYAWNVHLRLLGHIDGLEETLRNKVLQALDATEINTGMTLAVALNYGGRADLVDAVRLLIAKGIAAETIDEQMIATHLSTADMPDPDLVIRTSGEQRLSNFLLWESAHSRFWTTSVNWPDFKPEHLFQAIHASVTDSGPGSTQTQLL